MKTYKLWIEIEECDEENDTYVTLESDKTGMLPVLLGAYGTLDEALTAAEAFEISEDEVEEKRKTMVDQSERDRRKLAKLSGWSPATKGVTE